MLLHDGLHMGSVSHTIWADAVEQIRDGQLPHADANTVAGLEAAGISTPQGLDPKWALAVHVAQEATSGMETVATHQDTTIHAKIFVMNAHMLTVTSSTSVVETDAGLQANGMHPLLEIVLGSHVDPWHLLRRVLPPLDVVQMQPRLPRAEELEPLKQEGPDSLEEDLSEGGLTAPHRLDNPALPSSVSDALNPVASVFAYGLGQVSGKLQTSNDAWSVGR